jgi:hypothetical protein
MPYDAVKPAPENLVLVQLRAIRGRRTAYTKNVSEIAL